MVDKPTVIVVEKPFMLGFNMWWGFLVGALTTLFIPIAIVFLIAFA